MTNPYRAMCAELVAAWQKGDDIVGAINRARALLAQPVAEGPSLSDMTELFYRHMGEGSEVGFENAIAEALTRWGRPTPQPPADGEVAELTARLRAIRNDYGVKHSADCQRAADLLERLASDNAGLTAAADALWSDNVSLLDN